LFSDRIGQVKSGIVLIMSLSFELTFSLFVLLTQFFDNLALRLNFFLQRIILQILLHQLLFGLLPLFHQSLLTFSLFLKLELKFPLVLRLLFFSLFKSFATLYQLGLHISHKLLKLVHLFRLLLGLVFLCFLFAIAQNLDFLSFLLQFLKQSFDCFFADSLSTFRVQAL